MNFRLKNISLLFVSIFVALALGELSLRRTPPDWRPFLSFPPVQQTHSEPSADPVLRYIPKANAQGPFASHEFRTYVSINSQHMRDREYSIEKPAGTLRIAAMGDSFVFGWGVEAEESVSKLLEQRYMKNVPVMNFGISGYCSNQILEWLKTQALQFQPDIVLFFIEGDPSTCVTDVKFENGRMYWAWLPRERITERWRSFLMRHSYLFSFLSTTISDLRIRLRHILKKQPELPNSAPDLRQGFDILEELDTLSREKGFTPVIVHFHDDHEVQTGFNPLEELQFEALKIFCRQKHLHFLDLMGPLRKEWERTGRSPYFHYDPHWNKLGHEIAAKEIAAYLRREGILGTDRFQDFKVDGG